MWYVKKVASKVTNLTQNALRQKSKVQKQFEEVISNSNKVMPIRKMSDLAESSYSIENFEEIVKVVADKLKEIKFERKSLKKRLNVLVLVVYLIKHGAGGFIDQFRAMISDTFQRYQNIQNFLAQEDSQKRNLMLEIKERAKYIIILLTDKAKLLKQKQMGRLIKQKIYLQKEQKITNNQSQTAQNSSNQQDRIQSFLQHYVWRYTNKLDRKLDKLTDVLIAKIDEYLDGEMPDQFEIDEAEIQHQPPTTTKSQFQISGEDQRYKQAHYVRSKLLFKQSDLLQFPATQTVQSEPTNIDNKPQQLLQSEPQQSKPSLIETEQQAVRQQRIKQFQAMDDLQIQKFRSELIETATIPIPVQNEEIKEVLAQQVVVSKPQEVTE